MRTVLRARTVRSGFETGKAEDKTDHLLFDEGACHDAPVVYGSDQHVCWDNVGFAAGPHGALQLFGAGREKRIYAVPPYTDVRSLDFEDHPFSVQHPGHACALCGCTTSFLDEVVQDGGERLWTCSDTDWCREQQEEAADGAR